MLFYLLSLVHFQNIGCQEIYKEKVKMIEPVFLLDLWNLTKASINSVSKTLFYILGVKLHVMVKNHVLGHVMKIQNFP
jgi:hypothetical protein